MLSAMMESLRHRGRDRSGVLIKDSVGLLHLMNWTTVESLDEKLPAQSRRSPIYITCDARIDNRAELFPQLDFGRLRLSEISDSEIILAAYEKWGENCLPRLIGDFVFAIWDDRKKELFCGRDALGVKHFYYYYEPGKFFALASEIKALLALDAVPRRLNEEFLGDYLVLNNEDKEGTFYQNIKRLPATHGLTVNRERLKIRRYWQPDAREIRLKNDAEYQEAFREKFTEAVKCRLRSAFPTGAMLSGGLDSSSIVCAASGFLTENGANPLQTFSAIFPTVAELDARIDERGFMQSVIAKTGCQAHFVNADDASPLRDIDKVLWHADHPVGAPNVYMDWEIYRAAQKQNVRVLLSGTDGDSTVSHGYEDFARLVRRGRFLRLFKEAFALNRNMPRRSHSVKRLIWNRGFVEAAPASLMKIWRTLRRRKTADYQKSPIMFPLHFEAVKTAFREKYDLETRIVDLRQASYPNDCSAAEQHWNGLTSGHFSQTLEQLEKASAAFGIEPRYPFFDRRLIEFCIALPPGQRIYKGWTRSIFRHSMNGILPSDVQWRTDKSNIGASVKVNLLKYGFPLLEETFQRNLWKLEKYINPEKLQAAYRAYQSDPLRTEPEALLILTNVYLLKWLEQTGFSDVREKDSPKVQRAVAA